MRKVRIGKRTIYTDAGEKTLVKAMNRYVKQELTRGRPLDTIVFNWTNVTFWPSQVITNLAKVGDNVTQ